MLCVRFWCWWLFLKFKKDVTSRFLEGLKKVRAEQESQAKDKTKNEPSTLQTEKGNLAVLFACDSKRTAAVMEALGRFSTLL